MKFSMRNSQVLDLLQRGLTNKEIGQGVGISPHTIRVAALPMKVLKYALLVAGFFVCTHTSTIAQEKFDLPPVEVKAIRLKEVLSFEKYRSIRSRLQSISSESIEVVLTIDKFRPGDKLVLAQDEQQVDVAIGGNGELLIPTLEKILQSEEAVLMVPVGADPPKIVPRVRIKLPINQALPKQQLIDVVKQYETAGKTMYGWASFLVPTLNCLVLEYAAQERTVVALVKGNISPDREIKTNQRGMVFIDLSQLFENLTILKEPLWMWGCNFSRWKAEWE